MLFNALSQQHCVFEGCTTNNNDNNDMVEIEYLKHPDQAQKINLPPCLVQPASPPSYSITCFIVVVVD